MSNRTFIALCVACALMATSAFAAATQPSTGNQPPPQLGKIPPTPWAPSKIPQGGGEFPLRPELAELDRLRHCSVRFYRVRVPSTDQSAV